jgi:hypothetical protein
MESENIDGEIHRVQGGILTHKNCKDLLQLQVRKSSFSNLI